MALRIAKLLLIVLIVLAIFGLWTAILLGMHVSELENNQPDTAIQDTVYSQCLTPQRIAAEEATRTGDVAALDGAGENCQNLAVDLLPHIENLTR